MSQSVEIIPGSRIRLHLSLALVDGTEALSTFDDEPLELTLGDGTLQPGMELALYGLSVGDEQTLTLEPEQAYGASDESLVHQLPLTDFPAELQPEVGQIMSFATPNGEQTAGSVLAIEGEQVTIDFNHPLAGHQVVFRSQILQVDNP